MNDFFIQKEKAKEKMFEAMLEYAGACHAENIVEEMEVADEIEDQIPSPPELDARIKKLIARHERKGNFKKFWGKTTILLPKIAAIFFVVILSSAIFVVSVESLRIKVLNYIIEVQEEYTSIRIKDIPIDNIETTYPGVPTEWENVYIPTYIPEGFKIEKAESLAVIKMIQYSNDDGQLIIFNQSTNEKMDLRVDTENAKSEKININGFEGLIVEKNGLITIAWYNNDFSFYLKSQIDKNELVKMAESIKVKK